ncbi:MAG TPA: hypothetical protein DD706_19375 [Nitrospiraceae bacterium]|nr:hypothetical protein [Nitrospiraceae bacterium]
MMTEVIPFHIPFPSSAVISLTLLFGILELKVYRGFVILILSTFPREGPAVIRKVLLFAGFHRAVTVKITVQDC